MPTALLLAAGAGRRFAGGKLLASLADGTPLVLAAVRPLRQVAVQLLAVVRPEDVALQGLLADTGIAWVANPDPDRGMGSSIACGVAASRGADGWLIALGDMPGIRVATLQALQRALAGGAPLVAPVYRGRRGHPVGFGAGFGDALLALQGDAGARSILQQHAGQLLRLPVDDPGILQDVDMPDDLRDADRFIQRCQ